MQNEAIESTIKYYRMIEAKAPQGDIKDHCGKVASILETIGTGENALELFNSGIFNHICEGYLVLAAKEAGLDKKKVSELRESLKHVFDQCSAEEAEAIAYR